MKCSSCGREIPETAERCPGCGAPCRPDAGLMDALADELRGDEVDDFISQIDIDYGDDPEPEPEPVRGEIPRRSAVLRQLPLGWIVAGVLAVLLVVLAAVLIPLLLSRTGVDPTPTATPTPTESPAAFKIDVAALELRRGDTYKFSLDSTSGGVNASPEWSSSDPSVVTVDSYGVITAVAEGKAVVSATVGSSTVTCTVTVTANEYSEWTEKLPDGVTQDNYDIESARFYRFREKELTTSTETEMEGWTVYESSLVAGEYGEWSDWDTAPQSANQTREVETRTEYAYRNMTAEEQYGDWSDWGYWSTARQSGTSDALEENTRTTWRYFCYVCPECSTRSPVNYCTRTGCSGKMDDDDYVEAWSDVTYANALRFDWDGGSRYTGSETYYRTVIDQSAYFFEDVSNDSNMRTEYRYRTRSYIPAQYGEWSDWQSDEITANNTREVRTRTLYRYRVMETQSLNFFWRWAEWSRPVEYANDSESFESGEDIEFEDITLYRYRRK